MLNKAQLRALRRLGKKPYVISFETVPRTRIHESTLKALERRKLVLNSNTSEYSAWDITKKGRNILRCN